MHLVSVVAPADVAVNPGKLARGLLAPASLVQALRRDIDRDVVLAHAKLDIAVDAAVRATLEFGLETLERESVLHLQVDRAAKGVEAKHRIVRLHVGAINRIARNEIEMDRIAECF